LNCDFLFIWEGENNMSKNKVVVLDIGHGGRDSGAIGNKTQEKNNNLTLGLKIGKILQNHNVTVNYTRDTDKDFCPNSYDVNTDLQNRITIAKQYNPDVFISLHNNAYNRQAKGIECHCYKFGGTDEKLSRSIQKNMVSALNMMIDRKVKASNFYVLRKFDGTNTDACLVEYGFIDSEEDVILANMDIASIAISKGILEHLGIKYIEQSISTTQSINNNQGDGTVLNAVLGFSLNDLGACMLVSQKLNNCAIYFRNTDKTFNQDCLKADTLYVVGGSTVGHKKEKLLSGKEAKDTLQKVVDIL